MESSNRWDNKCCCFHGEETTGKAFISIKIDLPDPDGDPKYNYSETTLCRPCFNQYGIQPAYDHNNELREMLGLPVI